MEERLRQGVGEPPEEVFFAGEITERKVAGWTGMSREFSQVGEMLGAIESLPRNEVWREGDYSDIVLGMLKDVDVYAAIFGMERLAYYPASMAVQLSEKIGESVTDMRDKRGSREVGVMLQNAELVKTLEGEARTARIRKESLQLKRGSHQRGYYEERDFQTGKVDRRIPISPEETQTWIEALVDAGGEVSKAEMNLRSAMGDEKVQEARDFLTLVGFSPEGVLSMERFLSGDQTLTAEEKKVLGEIYSSREMVAYWLSASSRGVNSLVDFFPFVVKEKADLGTSADLLIKEYVPKPPNTEMFGVLRSKDLDMGVSEVFKALLQMDVVEVTYEIEQLKSDKGEMINVRVPKVTPQSDDIRKYWPLDDQGGKPFGRDESGCIRSLFNLPSKPEQRRDWLSRITKLVEDRMRSQGVEKAAAWARVSVPIALAYYEILLLGQRGATRRDVKGETIKVPKKRELEDESELVVTDFYGRVIYEDEKDGPGTITGWFDDLGEKASRTKSRFLGQGTQGFAAPTALAVFGTSNRYLRVMFEKLTLVEKGPVMLGEVREGRATVGDCFAVMNENARGMEALNLYRAVSLIEGIPSTPFAILDNVMNERKADNKFIDETVKYFKAVTKALSMVYYRQPEQIARVQVNLLSLIVRKGKRADVSEGGATTRGSEGFSFGPWFDKTFNVLRDALCNDAPIIHPAHFDLAVKLGVNDPVKDGDVMYNDRVGMILEEDIARNAELRRLLGLVFADNKVSDYNLVTRYGPNGKAAIGAGRDKYIDDLLRRVESKRWKSQ